MYYICKLCEYKNKTKEAYASNDSTHIAEFASFTSF